MIQTDAPLAGLRVLAAINGLELFGHERGNIEVFKTLREQGAEVRVGVNAKPNNDVARELNRLGFSTFKLPFGAQWSIQWLRKEFWYAFTNTWAAIHCSWLFNREVDRFRPTHVHLGSALVYSFIALALALRRAPLVYRMGDCPPVDSGFNLLIWRQAIRRATSLVVNSDFVGRSVNAVVPMTKRKRKLALIYNLAPKKENNSEVDKEVPNTTPGMGGLIYVGSLSEHKGLLHLVEAFAQIANRYPTLTLDIIGGSRFDAVFRARLGELVKRLSINERVVFHGYVNDPDRFFKKTTAIHVAPSLWEEPAANVVLEAKREGTPSLVYPSGGLPELVHHERDGYVCREKSVTALVQGLHWMLKDTARLQEMRSAAKADFCERFGAERFASQWREVYLTTIVRNT